MNKKLILFDIDGTIVCYKSGEYIPDSTVKAIRLLQKNGHHVAVATGRSLYTSKSIMKKLDIKTGILHDGAQIISNSKTLFERKIRRDVSRKLCRILSGTALSVFAFDGEGIYSHNMSPEVKNYLEEQAEERDFIKQLNASMNSLFSIYIFGKQEDIPIDFTKYKSLTFDQNLYELASKGISKGTALVKLAGSLNIDMEDTVAIGDGLNDIELLRTANIGIAVGSACDELKQASDMVTGDIENGGIYNAFRELKLI